MTRTRRIGIVAVSAEGAALCYRTLCAEAAALLGPHRHPEVTMHTYPLADYMQSIDANRWDEVGKLLIASAEIVMRAGAEIVICPDNTVHEGMDLVSDRLPGEWLHIADEVARVAGAHGFRRLGILGTRYLMESQVYPKKLAPRGIDYEIPESNDRERINTIIFEELVYGRFEAASRETFVTVIEKLRGRGCDAVVLGCTEIPLLIDDNVSPLPTIDSTRTLARAALRAAIET